MGGVMQLYEAWESSPVHLAPEDKMTAEEARRRLPGCTAAAFGHFDYEMKLALTCVFDDGRCHAIRDKVVGTRDDTRRRLVSHMQAWAAQ